MGEYSLAEAMKEFLDKSRLKSQMHSVQIEEVWEKIMGKTIAKYTEKISLSGGKLYITTFVAPLKQELTYQKDAIIKRVNEALGEQVVKEVIIQ